MGKSPLSNQVWTTTIQAVHTTISLTQTRDRSIAVVAVNQAHGIGSVFDANEAGVQCLLGTRKEGMEEACAMALVRVLGCRRVILTIALLESSSDIVKSLLSEFRTISDTLVV